MAEHAAHRRGQPEPLIFHLSSAAAGYAQALSSAAALHHPDFPWHPELQDAAARLSEPNTLSLAAETASRMGDVMRGIEAWQQHPYRMRPRRRPALWQKGAARLLDYKRRSNPNAPVVLVIPSLINRAYVLDLLPERSFLRELSRRGLRPLLLDWGEPGEAEYGYDIDAYGHQILLPAIETSCDLAGGPVGVIGYCMGGTIATGLAANRPDLVNALALIGAPWDFSDERGIAGGLRMMSRHPGGFSFERLLDGQATAFGHIPVPVFQMLFALIDPFQAAVKFRRFARQPQEGRAARLFVALEDWLADGIPMAHGAAHDLLFGWHSENRTATGRWRFLGDVVDPARIGAPTLIFHGSKDMIAPTPLCAPLAHQIPGAELQEISAGQVGMIIGSAAKRAVIEPIVQQMRHAECA